MSPAVYQWCSGLHNSKLQFTRSEHTLCSRFSWVLQSCSCKKLLWFWCTAIVFFVKFHTAFRAVNGCKYICLLSLFSGCFITADKRQWVFIQNDFGLRIKRVLSAFTFRFHTSLHIFKLWDTYAFFFFFWLFFLEWSLENWKAWVWSKFCKDLNKDSSSPSLQCSASASVRLASSHWRLDLGFYITSQAPVMFTLAFPKKVVDTFG